MKANSVKGDFGENRGGPALKVVKKVMYWEFGAVNLTRTCLILIIYKKQNFIFEILFFRYFFDQNTKYFSKNA